MPYIGTGKTLFVENTVLYCYEVLVIIRVKKFTEITIMIVNYNSSLREK